MLYEKQRYKIIQRTLSFLDAATVSSDVGDSLARKLYNRQPCADNQYVRIEDDREKAVL